MVISLKKGEKIDLTKSNPGLAKVRVALGWDANKKIGGRSYDLDASVFLLDRDGRLRKNKNMIYYGNKRGQGVYHTGDNLTGDGDGDDEVLELDLSQIERDVDRIMFTVNIYQAESKKQSFGEVKNAYIRVINPLNNKELIRYDLGEEFSTETGVIVAEIYREEEEWKFSAVGTGFRGGLSALKKSLTNPGSDYRDVVNETNERNEEIENQSRRKGFFGRLFG